MRFKLVCVGKPKGPFADLSRVYERRIKHYARFDFVEIAEASYKGRPKPAEIERILGKEAQGIQRALNGKEYVIALDVGGEQTTSEEFAARLERLVEGRRSEIAFVIGGSLGLHSSIKAMADSLLSLGTMTFPHQLARVVLLEQLYRAMTLRNNEAYHK